MERLATPPSLTFHPATPDRWADLESLFGPQGAYGGCWCMWWRSSRFRTAQNLGAGNKAALKQVVDSGQIPGILAYAGESAIGWCSVAPRDTYTALERSRTLNRIDDQPVWSIVCFYIAKSFRKRRIMRSLIEAAVEYVRARGGQIIEAYPVSARENASPVTSYMGFADTFLQAGFTVVQESAGSRLIVRRYV